MDVDDILSAVGLLCAVFIIFMFISDCDEHSTSDEYLKGLNDGYEEFNSTKLELCEEYKQDVTVDKNSDDYFLVESTRQYCSGYIDGYEKRRIEELTNSINEE